MTESAFAAKLDTLLPLFSSVLESPRVIRLGSIDYQTSLERMRDFTAQRTLDTQDQIWLLQHPPVFTLGQAGRIEHLLDTTTTIPVIRVERGGQITFHGQGQMVAYTMVDLRRRDIKVREFVQLLEGALIDTLATYNIAATRKPGAPGIYVDWQGQLAKIGALGLKVKNGSTFHGVALNVAMDLTPFKAINPCGYEGLVTVDMQQLGVFADVNQVGERLAEALVGRIDKKDWS